MMLSFAAVGKAVTEIAHDMKTPLMAIGGFARQVTRRLGKDDPNRRKLNIMIQETVRLDKMVRQMLDFGRPVRLQESVVELNEVLGECVELTQKLAEEANVRIESTIGSPILCRIDADKMKQVFLNLISNAVQASPVGEEVWVSTEVKNHTALFHVTDRGSGIKKEHQESIFHPFFTTKESGNGLGLGISKRIVEAHGGEIRFSPNDDKGVTFTVGIPCREESPSEAEQDDSA